jgi:hypothetical protein
VTLQIATKLPSLLMTMISTVPAATPVTVRVLPLTVTVAFEGSELATRKDYLKHWRQDRYHQLRRGSDRYSCRGFIH